VRRSTRPTGCRQIPPAILRRRRDGTRAFLRIANKFRLLAPPEMRDEQMGMRIGLLTQLPTRATWCEVAAEDGEGGGPDSYDHVKDVA